VISGDELWTTSTEPFCGMGIVSGHRSSGTLSRASLLSELNPRKQHVTMSDAATLTATQNPIINKVMLSVSDDFCGANVLQIITRGNIFSTLGYVARNV